MRLVEKIQHLPECKLKVHLSEVEYPPQILKLKFNLDGSLSLSFHAKTLYLLAAADMQLDLYAAGAGNGDLTLEDPSLGGVTDCLPELFRNGDRDSSDIIITLGHSKYYEFISLEDRI